ncbi:hypothetical protein UlMin_040156, partial [Ulmus minor]
GALELQLRCPQNIDGIVADPEPDWSFDALLSELNSLEMKLVTSTSGTLVPFTRTKSRYTSNGKSQKKSSRPFVMNVLENETDDIEGETAKVHDQNYMTVNQFGCDVLYLSTDDENSEDESTLEAQPYLMEEGGLVEGALFELGLEHQLGVKEEIRNKISAFEMDLMSENEKSTSALARVEKYIEARRETEIKLDNQYQRKMAEALDNHLSAIQRDHELKSQVEERKIRSDAAYEEAKRKEKAFQEEKLRQEKAKAEAEAKLRAEEAKRAALEAEQKAASEAAGAEREVTPKINEILETLNAKSNGSENDKSKQSASMGDIVKVAESALKLEQDRLKKLKDLNEENNALGLSLNKDINRHERNISKLIRQITGTRDVVRQKAEDLVKNLKSPLVPQSISFAAFAKKVVSYSENPGSAAFACAYVVVLVNSQVPRVMDLVLAELHKACIYTVPKHIAYSQSAFELKETYYKTIGFREDQGKIESVDNYLKRVESCMKFYAALVQTEVPGIQNTHGLKDGWAWFARFLNSLPASRFTAVALSAFLR